jgi:ElaB/YqjD/DUF883 family membrane-anchored ribosome-binding protein
MAYKKRSESGTEMKAQVKLIALKNFDNANGSVINYASSGKNQTSADYEQKLNDCKTLRDDLNTLLDTADEKVSSLNKEVKELKKMSSKFLSAVKSRFGEDSTEYDQMGGTKMSDRKRPLRKKKTNA